MRVFALFIKYVIRLGPINFLSYLYQRFYLKKKFIQFKVPGLKDKISIRNASSDIPLFADIFIRREYDVKLRGDVRSIIDCGANIGLASLYFLSKYPDAKIIAIEPERNNYNLLQQNLQNYSNVTCLNKGIWNKTALLNIINKEGANHAFIVEETDIRSDDIIEAVSVSDLMKEYEIKEIDILKVDIEGSEEQVFLDNPPWLKKVRMIFCEIHENMKPGLTEKITSLFNSGHEIYMHGEYHVFKKKEF